MEKALVSFQLSFFYYWSSIVFHSWTSCTVALWQTWSKVWCHVGIKGC